MKYLLFMFLLNNVSEASLMAHSRNKQVNLDMTFQEVSKLTEVNYKLLRAICWVESKHNPDLIVILDGDAPSYGICQIQLRTARENGFKGTAKELMYAPNNIYFAAKNLKRWLNRTRNHWMKAATGYNRGHLSKNLMNSYVKKVQIALKEER